MTAAKIRVCFVCSGNICRSPTAEGVLKKLVADAGLEHAFHVESAGIGSWHVGEADHLAEDDHRSLSRICHTLMSQRA